MAEIQVVPVTSSSLLRHFIVLPWVIYRQDPNWVPQLLLDQKKLLNKKSHPFFKHSNAQFFLAQKNGEFVGRIAAILNNNHNQQWQEKIGFFGFFEAANDQRVAEALFETAKDWCRSQGLTRLRGPMNYSTNETCGLLVEGFDTSPVIMMTHNPPYYAELLEKAGFEKVMDLYAWYMTKEVKINEKLRRVGERIMKEHGIVVRSLNPKQLADEVAIIKRIYTDAWTSNWGFVPMTSAEFDHMAKDLKPILDPRIAMIAEKQGEAVGFSLCLPDYNQALKKINGRLLPFGLIKLLYFARKIRTMRVLALGVVKSLQSTSGIGAALYLETFKRGLAAGYEAGEFSWTLENNTLINRAMQMLGATLYKRYRIYELSL